MRAERDGVKDFDMGPSLEEILAKCEEETGLPAPVLQEPLPWAKLESGEDALLRLESVTVDLILMDVNMPGMGGIEATRRMVRLLPDVKVIALTVAGLW